MGRVKPIPGSKFLALLDRLSDNRWQEQKESRRTFLATLLVLASMWHLTGGCGIAVVASAVNVWHSQSTGESTCRCIAESFVRELIQIPPRGQFPECTARQDLLALACGVASR